MSTIIIITPPVKPKTAMGEQQAKEALEKDIEKLREAGFIVEMFDATHSG